jgi:hypothetical protein
LFDFFNGQAQACQKTMINSINATFLRRVQTIKRIENNHALSCKLSDLLHKVETSMPGVDLNRLFDIKDADFRDVVNYWADGFNGHNIRGFSFRVKVSHCNKHFLPISDLCIGQLSSFQWNYQYQRTYDISGVQVTLTTGSFSLGQVVTNFIYSDKQAGQFLEYITNPESKHTDFYFARSDEVVRLNPLLKNIMDNLENSRVFI